ncbi:DUF1941-domain-containing protein [Xylariaceae sp. FL0594]|nr:DUF1941-domain-containing protein [Xylariaceae sp. FL0594]
MEPTNAGRPEVQKIHQLLAAKDDTSRFVGLVLLKTTLDNHASDLSQDEVRALWDSISPRFLDRLIRTGSRPAPEQRKQAGDMLDVAVAVIYTFVRLLNDCALSERFYSRIPKLLDAVLYSSKETTQRIVDVINALVQQPASAPSGGATFFSELEVSSWAPLIEIAPQHEHVFAIFNWAWVNGSSSIPPEAMRNKIDEAMQLLISSFKGHYPGPLLDFVALILDNLPPHLRSKNAGWLRPLTRLIQDLVSNKQTENGRKSYIVCASTLLVAFPEEAPKYLFCDEPNTPKPLAYLFVKMVQVDIASTLHILMPKVNSPEYPSLTRRISSALDIMTSFVGFLITASDDDTIQHGLTPDRILKLHEDLARTVGDVMEYLRDRWEDFLAGSRGLESTQSSKRSIFEDLITPAAIRFVATWLRDDDGEALRSQAAGLTEVFGELYKMSLTSTDTPELRLPILAALEGMLQTSSGRQAFKEHDIWSRCLYPDLRSILVNDSSDLTSVDYLRGSAIIHTVFILIDEERSLSSHPAAADLLEFISKLDIRPVKRDTKELERPRVDFQADALELAATLLNDTVRGSATAHQERIRSALSDIASKVSGNLETLDDEAAIERIRQLDL